LDVTAKTDYLVAHLALETHYHSHRYQHHSQSQRYADDGYTHCRARHLLIVTLLAIESIGYE
jgi:hypothetical protein